MKVKCPYCSKPAELTTGYDIYPYRTDLYGHKYYKCVPCDAFVGCHPRTDKPLGTLAKPELRKMRSTCHRLFDPLWKNGKMTRFEAYSLLSKIMRVGPSEAHIGMFNMGQCRDLIDRLYELELIK